MANIKTREKVEIDFSKLDLSQLQMCYETEMEVWRMLRMGEELLDLWKIGYDDTSAVDYTNGIRVP
jgi:hypothetical protein